MPVSPSQYAAKAEELERLAESIRDPAIKNNCLELAIELRRVSARAFFMQSDEEVQQLAERMVANTTSKL